MCNRTPVALAAVVWSPQCGGEIHHFLFISGPTLATSLSYQGKTLLTELRPVTMEYEGVRLVIERDGSCP